MNNNDNDAFVIRPPELKEFPQFVHYTGDQRLLTDEECDRIIAFAEARELSPGSIGNGKGSKATIDPSYRTVMQTGLWPSSPEMRWLFERVRDRIVWTNNDFFRFDLSVMQEGFNYLRYDVGDEAKGVEPGHYNWHQDFGGGRSATRKLSMVIQLSDPKDYDGCRLELFTNVQFAPKVIERGSAIIFPSWTPHQVTPITRGVRRSLACWVGGPQFR